MKIYSLLKATFSQDMNLFKVSVNKESSKFKKIIVPFLLFCIILYAMGTYAFGIAQILVPMNMTHVMLTLFIIVCTVISFIEAIYKSQGILFDSKDNDLLLSLPIKKSQILFVRILKLLVFQYFFNLMILLPAFIVYAYYTSPEFNFYIMSLIMTVLVPIIPTVLGSVIGYVVMLISFKFRKKKLVQTILSIITTFAIFTACVNINGLMNGLLINAQGINKTIVQAYYPIGLYLNLITKFNLIDLILLLITNIIPLGIFILIGAKYYYSIISKTSEGEITNESNYNKEKIAYKKPIVALTIKELKRYFSSPIYIINTLFGPVIILLTTIFLCIKGINVLISGDIPLPFNISTYLPAIYYALVVTVCGLTQITASSISLEGKTINITRSLPISEKTIFDSKIIMSLIIQSPFVILSNILFIIKFRIGLIYSLLIFGITFAAMLLSSCFGLIINLKYPKMNANNDTEIVKQSMSVMIATFSGMIFSALSIGIAFYLSLYISIELALLCHLAIILVLGVISYGLLIKYGTSMYRRINI